MQGVLSVGWMELLLRMEKVCHGLGSTDLGEEDRIFGAGGDGDRGEREQGEEDGRCRRCRVGAHG